MSTVESELLNTAAQLLVSLLGVVHGQAGKRAYVGAAVLDLVCRPVVGLSGCILGQGFIRNTLDFRNGHKDEV